MSGMDSFQDAFYIIAKELGFDYAQPLSPCEVFEQQILPRIRELVATQRAAGEPIHQWADQDLWMDGDEADMASARAEGFKTRTLWTAPPAAAHGDEAVQIKLPEFILCSDEMHERGKHTVERAIEDQCFGRWTQFKVYFEAAIGEWLSQQEDAPMRAQGGGEVQ